MNTINSSLKTRNYGIDLLRIISMLMVVYLHILGKGGVLTNTTIFTFKYEFAWLLEILCFGAVNCFVLITGYVYYGKETKYYRLFAIWAEVLFYSIIITLIFMCLMPSEITLNQIWQSCLPSYYNLYWFFSAYVGMYLFSPLINIGLNNFNKKQDIIAIGTLIIIFSVLPTILNREFAFSLNKGYSVIWLMILYYIGGTIHKYNLPNKISKKKGIIIWITCGTITWFLKIILESFFFTSGDGFYPFISYISPLCLIGSIGLLCFFKNLKITNTLSIATIRFLAPVCFATYLIHCHFLIWEYFIKDSFIFLTNLNSILMILSILIIGLLIFIICSLTDWIREIIFRKLKIKSKLANLEVKINSKLDELLYP